MTSRLRIDPLFDAFFGDRLRQVFLYITDDCNACCEYCLYKTTLARRDIPLSVAKNLLGVFRKRGAEKVTLIGGEPTLYGQGGAHERLVSLLSRAKELGYVRTRMDTNGKCLSRVASRKLLRVLDDVAVSLDSHVPHVNDSLRGEGAFGAAVSAIRLAAERGFSVSVTACIHEPNVDSIDDFIAFCADLGVREVNLHPLFLMGVKRDSFTGDSHITPERWMSEYRRIAARREASDYSIHVRAPQRFVDSQTYARTPEAYDYCPVRMGERILVHPDGTMRICALTIGTRTRLAEYTTDGIQMLSPHDPLSEINPGRTHRHPCMSQIRDFGALAPLCISFKPGQTEYVWNSEGYDSAEFISVGAPVSSDRSTHVQHAAK